MSGALQRELIQALRRAAADLNRRRHLHEDVHAGNAAQLRPQLVHDLIGAKTLAVRLESDEDASLVPAAAARLQPKT